MKNFKDSFLIVAKLSLCQQTIFNLEGLNDCHNNNKDKQDSRHLIDDAVITAGIGHSHPARTVCGGVQEARANQIAVTRP